MFRSKKPSEHLAVEKPGIAFADLSNNQGSGTYHAATYCEHYPFLIHKASQGTGFRDELHASRTEETHVHGRAVGHYHYIGAGSDPVQAVAEADNFLTAVSGHVIEKWPGHHVGDRTDFFVIDFEVPCTRPNEVIAAFFHRVRKQYPTVTIKGYSNYARIRELGLVIPSNSWWVAAYPGPVVSLPNGQKIWAHQFTDKGHCQGIAGPCDKSIIVDKHSRKYWTQ